MKQPTDCNIVKCAIEVTALAHIESERAAGHFKLFYGSAGRFCEILRDSDL